MKFSTNLDKLGVVGIFFTAITSPCCFPLFGFILTAMGWGSFELFGGWTAIIFQAFVVLSLIGIFLSFRQHKNIFPLLIALISSGLIFYAYHFYFDTIIIYIGMTGLLVSAVYNFYIIRKNNINCKPCSADDNSKVELNSTITCPHCGFKKIETMPTNACQFFYTCEQCKTRLKPKEGDCCVYCSYGSVKCPPIQMNKNCC
ncbi:MAG: MerC domain-containing protein [Chitinophagaceae bacterium]|nr:MAG: MerC domain-containing protein [Chitinophagaceae bacterium]